MRATHYRTGFWSEQLFTASGDFIQGLFYISAQGKYRFLHFYEKLTPPGIAATILRTKHNIFKETLL